MMANSIMKVSVSSCLVLLVMISVLSLLVLNSFEAQAADSRPVRVASAKGAVTRTPALPATTVTELKHWSNPDYTRIAVSLDHEAEFETHAIRPSLEATAPSRIYIDIKGARVAKGVKDDPVGDGLLKTARVGQYRPDVVRVVLDVENIKEYKVFSLSDPFRIIIDVKGERKTEISKLEESITNLQREKDRATEPRSEAAAVVEVPATAETPMVGEKVERKTPPKFKPGRIRRIVVDPGHGGQDPGAIGAGNTMEKDIVLAIGLKLADRLRSELGMDVVMTRSTDIFIPLEERTAIANKVNADLFISVHANASLNRKTIGIETYYLNLAKTDKAKQLAARENNTSLEKVSVLQGVLFDLMANSKINDSAHLADEVQKGTYKRVSSRYPAARNNGVKQGPFYVLLGATMPSILVETAFLSNEAEEKNLNDPEYQEATVEGIVDGVRSYCAGIK
jgi:N-acetylmuramoyl-L-alanine amidase